MTPNFDHESNQVEDEYYGEEQNDLDDFIVYSDDDEDKPVKKQKLHQLQDKTNQEEEEDFEEEVVAPIGAREILSLREKLKEEIRRKNAAMAAGVDKCSSSAKQAAAPPAKDRFGTFFGSSRRSLALRVIREGSSSMVKERQNARTRNNASLVSKAQPGASRSSSKPKIASEKNVGSSCRREEKPAHLFSPKKRKADALRENRDYSSLFSEDAEASPSTKERTGNMPAIVPKPGVQVCGQVNCAGKNRHGLKGAPPSSRGRAQNKAGSTGKSSTADRKGAVAAVRNGPCPGALKKTTGSQPSLPSKRPHAVLPHNKTRGQNLQPALSSQRRQSDGHHQIRKHASSAQGHRSGQNGSAEANSRAKPAQKQHAPSSKLKVAFRSSATDVLPLSQNVNASRPVEKGATKRKSDDNVDYALISKEIGAILGYDRSKYAGIDEDDSNMEADFASIQNAKLARQEDQEQLRLIEEERRERARKRKKASTNAREIARTEC